MKTNIITIISGILIMLSTGSYSQEINLNGFVDSYHAVRISEPNDFMSSRTRFRGEIKGSKDKSDFFTSFNANYNNLLSDLTGVDFREAWYRYEHKNFNIKIGRQIVSWGQADGIPVTDLISPKDMTEFLARDYDDIRMPVDAIRLKYLYDNMSAELIMVPVFQASILPVDDQNPWSFINSDDNGFPINIYNPVVPEQKLENSEVGGRLSFNLSGLDFGFSGLYTWNKTAVFSSSFSDNFDTLHLTPEHHRMGMCGFEFSRPQGQFVIRGEGAFLIDKKFNPSAENYYLGLVEKNSLNMLVGLDWYPGNEWMLTAQLSDEVIFDHEVILESNEHTLLATLSISKKLFRSKLAISTFIYTALDENTDEMSFFDRTSFDYALSDQIHLLAGVDIFHGDAGLFAPYKDNSEIWIKAKYSF